MGAWLGVRGPRLFVSSATLALSFSLPAAAQFSVDSRVDASDAHLGDGICDDGSGHCTLRAAVEEANASPGADFIDLPADGAAPDDGLKLSHVPPEVFTAQLQIFGDLTIEGQGAGLSTISGNLTTPIMNVRSMGVYVLDITRNQVLAYSWGATTLSVAFSFPGTASRLISGSDGTPGEESFILATDAGVLRYSKDGQPAGTLIPATVGGQVVNAADVTLGPFSLGHDKVFAANSAPGGAVYRYDPANGSVTRFVQDTDEASRLTWVLVPDANGVAQPELLVLYSGEKRIAKYSSTGAFLGNLVGALPGNATAMVERGNVLYVTIEDQSSIVKYDVVSGNSLGTFVASGSGGLHLPLSLEFAPDGELFVTDAFSVRKFDGRNGQFGNVFAVGNPSDTTGLRFPRDVLFLEDHVTPGAEVSLTHLTLAHGRLGDLGAAGLATTRNSFVRLQEATIEDNMSDGLGAGIRNFGLMDANRVRITNNGVTQAAQGGATALGGGILNHGLLLLSDSLVDHNVAAHGGGLACANPDAEVQATNTAFIANASTGGGAGVRAATSCTVSLNFCTVTDNVVSPPTNQQKDPAPYGGGIFAGDSGVLNVGNSIIAGNTDAYGPSSNHYSPDCFGETAGSILSFTDNLIQVVNASCPILDGVTGTPPTDLLTGDPELGPLADNGGPTPSRQPENGSPAIDGDVHVSPYELFQCPAGDQRFFIRHGAGANCDIGSVEVLENVQFDFDHDGLEDTIDLDPQGYSFAFSDLGNGGNTSGELISEGEQTIAIRDADGAGVTISADPAGGAAPAQFSLCSDHVIIELGAGQTRTVTCVTANAGPDQTLECTASTGAAVTLTGSGTSLSGSPVTYGWASPGVTLQQASQAVATGNFSLGTHVVTLTVQRGSDVTTDTAVIKVVDTTPPVLNVPPDVTAVTCTAVNIGQATATDRCGSVTITNDAPSSYRAGVRLVTWRATDQSGNQTVRTQRVVVGLGDNQACCPAGYHVMVGTSNNDTLTGTSGNDCILGLGAQDTIRGMGGDDVISGGDGDDILEGGDGNDLIDGGSGQDTLRGQAGNDSLLGQAGDDQCYGGDGDDVLFGGDGQDRLFGENGNDVLYGEAGSDRLDGGIGNDMLNGGASTDTCAGGGGTDTILACEL